jgi:hypothetical protein
MGASNDWGRVKNVFSRQLSVISKNTTLDEVLVMLVLKADN